MSDKSRIDEDFSRMIKLAGLSEAPKKAAANPQDIEGKGSFGGIFGNPKGSDYQSSGGQVVGKDGKVNWGDPDSASDFFRADKMQQAQQAQQAAPTPKAAAPKPAAPGQSVDDIKAFQRANGLTPDGIVGPKTRAAGWGQTAVPAPSSTTPGEKTPWAPKGPQAADLAPPIGSTVSRDGGPANLQMTDEPVRIPVRGNADAPRTAMNNFGINGQSSNSGAPNYPQSSSTTPPSSNTPPGYKSPVVTDPDNPPRVNTIPRGQTGSRDPRPPANIINPLDNIDRPTYSANAPTVDNAFRNSPSALVTNLDGTPRPQGGTGRDPRPPANPKLAIGGQEFNPLITPKRDLTSELPPARSIAPAPMPVIRSNTPNVDNMPTQQFRSGNVDNMPVIQSNPPPAATKPQQQYQYTPVGPNTDAFTNDGKVNYTPLGYNNSNSSDVDYKGNPILKAGKYDGSMFNDDIINELRELAGLDEDSKPDYLDFDKDGDEDEPMTKALKDKEEKVDEADDMEEGNEFSGALAKAKASHQDEFEVGGKTYNVKEGIEVNPISDSLALMKRLAGLK